MYSTFAGEVRFVVENNGKQRVDTGFNRNLILNQGLHFFGGGKGSDLMNYCLVGAGNSAPTITQNQMDNCVTGITGSIDSNSYNYVYDGTNTYKCSLTKKYVFTNLAGQNISEVGLASEYSSPSVNYLCTRALVKDANGNPTVLSLIAGDTLTIYYKLWVVHSTLDTNQVISMSNGFGNTSDYNIKSRLSGVASRDTWATNLGRVLFIATNDVRYYSGEITTITGNNTGNLNNPSAITFEPYANNFSRVMTIISNTSSNNGDIRTVVVSSIFAHAFGFRQIRFGSVANDSPILKDNTKELTIPIRFTWGRYEGAL